MRKYMTKEVTKTTVRVAKMVQGEDGLPKAEVMPNEILIGNVNLEKAQREITKKYEGQTGITVFGVEPSTEVYELSVEDFLKHAKLKVETPAPTEEAAPETEQESA